MKTPNEVNFSDFTFDTLLTKLRSNEPFRFLRFGDGEMRCVLHPGHGANCDGHHYFPDLSDALLKVLDDQNQNQTAYMGLQRFGDNQYPHFKEHWPNIKWCNADILHHASIKGRLFEIFKEIPGKRYLGVGPLHLWKLDEKYATGILVEVPDKDCWKSFDRVYNSITYNLITEKLTTIFLSCSMMAEPLIHELGQKYPNATLIDAGSVFDPYCGVKSRSYHHKLEIK